MPRLRPITTVPTDEHGVASLSAAIDAGHARDVVQRDVAAGRLQRVHRGVYVEPNASGQAAVHAAVAHLGAEAVFVIDAAARAHGTASASPGRPLHVALPPGLEKRQRPGLALHWWQLPPEQITLAGGVQVTTIPRTLADCCRLLPRYDAVTIVDSALHLGLVVPQQFEEILALMHRKPRCRTGRVALQLARVGAQSPLETRVRLRANDGGYPPDALQVPIRGADGRVLGFGDLGY